MISTDIVEPISLGYLRALEFYPINDNLTQALKVIDISTTTVYNTDKSPAENGLASTKMSAWGNYNCTSCTNKSSNCIGHPGRMQLNTKIISPCMFKVVLNCLRIICHNCYKVYNRILMLNKTSIKITKCQHCGFTNPKVKASKYHMCFEFTKDSETTTKTPDDVYYIIDGISDETIKSLGINPISHPRNYFLNYLMITSISTRPPVKIPGKEKYNINDITSFYSKIYDYNAELAKTDKNITSSRLDRLNKLYSIINNTIYKAPTTANLNLVISNNKSDKSNSIMEKFQTKLGLLRFSALGGTIRECARTIITLDPTIPIDTLIVPYFIATTITKREVVQPYNIKRLQIYLNNAITGKYPACKEIIKKSTGLIYKITPGQNNHILEYGDSINRNLIDGDTVLFNRQPTLNTGSIQRHTIYISLDPKKKSFRMSDAACGPYNADFDGDAMNIINPTSAATCSEVDVLCKMSNQLISFGDAKSQIKHIQDAIIGGVKLTYKGKGELRKFTRSEVMCLFANNIYIPTLLNQPNDKMYTGYDIFSMIFPKKIYVKETPNMYQTVFEPFIPYAESDKTIEIIDGRMQSGIHDSSAMAIYRAIANEYNADEAMKQMFNTHQVCLNALGYMSFSASILDFQKNDEMYEKTKQNTEKLLNASYLITKRLLTTGIVSPLGKTINQHYEDLQLNELRDDYKNAIMSNLSENNNNIVIQALSKASGDFTNISKLFGSNGQTLHKGRRMQAILSHARSTYYSRRFDLSPESSGFIKNSVVDGINPEEFFCQAVSSRDDLVEKTQGVAVAGANARMLIKNLESIVINISGQCIQTDGKIIQQLYGGDGFDIRYSDSIIIPGILKSDVEMLEEYKPKAKYGDNYESTDQEFALIMGSRQKLRDTYLKLEYINSDQKVNSKIPVPISIFKLMKDSMQNAYNELKDHTNTEEELEQMRNNVANFVERLPYLYSNDIQADKKSPLPMHMKRGISLIKYSIYHYLYTKNLRLLSINVLNGLLAIINIRLRNALLDTAMPIGCITALCVSSPLTQLSLNSIHVKGDGKSKIVDIQSFKEIFSLLNIKDCRSPRMIISLLPNTSMERGNEIANSLETLQFKIFVNRYDIISEKIGKITSDLYKSDQKYVDEFFKLSLIPPPADLLHWCIRFQINSFLLILKNITMETIINAIYSEDIFIVNTNDVNDDNNIFIRIYLKNIFNGSSLVQVKNYADNLMEKVIRGIKGIISAKCIEGPLSVINSSGALVTEKRIKIYTEGVNLMGMYNLQNRIKEIDYHNIQCDNIKEVEKYYGLGAAKITLLQELKKILKDINYRHYTIIADLITSTGTCTPINPNGPAIRNANLLLMLGNRAPLKIYENAVMYNKKADVVGLTGSLVSGVMPKMGSTTNTVMVNVDFIRRESEKQDKKIKDHISDILLN